MNNAIEITIYDNEGNCLINDNVNSPFIGLQTGEIFWFGEENKRTWAKVIKINYGLNTNKKCFNIEMVVEKVKKGETKIADRKTNFLDHGEKKIIGEYGGSWSINNSDIIVTVGEPMFGRVDRITIQVNSLEGTITKTEKELKTGDFFEVITKYRKITCTLINANRTGSGYSIVRVTESNFI